jgi:hypothetical protein
MNIHPTSHISSKKTQIEKNEEDEEFEFTHSDRVQGHAEKGSYIYVCIYI